MRRYGLIGYPLSHSKSKVFFEELFVKRGLEDYSYDNFSLESETAVKSFLSIESDLRGLNFTSPYKRFAYQLCDALSPEAAETGSVNCIHFHENKIYGHNTDVYGFVKSIEPLLEFNSDLSALILGTGGAAAAAIFGLRSMGVHVKCIGRGANEFYANGYNDMSAEELSSFQVVVNATPLGTWPNIQGCAPLPYEGIHKNQVLFDMVYNPEITEFMKRGINAGCIVKNGEEMLYLQAMKSWEIWTGDIKSQLQ